MSERIFRNEPGIPPELAELLEKAKDHKMTPDEIREQRISFAYGNAAIENPNVTKDMVRKAADWLDWPVNP